MKTVFIVLTEKEGYLLFKQAYASQELALKDIEAVRDGVYLPPVLVKQLEIISE